MRRRAPGPRRTSHGSGSPKPGTGRAQYSWSANARRFTRPTSSRQATSRGQARQATISASRASSPRARSSPPPGARRGRRPSRRARPGRAAGCCGRRRGRPQAHRRRGPRRQREGRAPGHAVVAGRVPVAAGDAVGVIGRLGRQPPRPVVPSRSARPSGRAGQMATTARTRGSTRPRAARAGRPSTSRARRAGAWPRGGEGVEARQHVVERRPPSSSPALSPWPRRSSARARHPGGRDAPRRSRRGSPCGCRGRGPRARRSARRAGHRGPRSAALRGPRRCRRGGQAAEDNQGDLVPSRPPMMPLDQVLPPSAAVTSEGHLSIGGCDLVELAEEHGTPLVVYDEGALRATAGATARPSRRTTPASRSSTPARPTSAWRCCGSRARRACRWTSRRAASCTPRCGPASRPSASTCTATTRTRAEIGEALDAGVGTIILDNLDEIALLEREAAARGVRQRVLVRVTPGREAVDPLLHRHRPARLEVRLLDRGRRRRARRSTPCAASDALDLDGPALPHRLAALRPRRATRPRRRSSPTSRAACGGDDLGVMNMGGGLGIAYTRADRPGRGGGLRRGRGRGGPRASGGASACRSRASWWSPGRRIVGRAGVTVYRVGGDQGRSPASAPTPRSTAA